MKSVNGFLCVFSIFGDTFSRSREKAVFESEKKEVRTVFYIFLTFSWQIDANVNHMNGFSSIFAANICSCPFSANDNKWKPGLWLRMLGENFWVQHVTNNFIFHVNLSSCPLPSPHLSSGHQYPKSSIVMDEIPLGIPSIGAAYASFNEQKFKFIGFTYGGEVAH